MKSIIFTVVATLIGVVNAKLESEFVAAYDAGKYEDAAKMIEGLDASRPEVARRLGVMYFNAKGVMGDQTKGRELLVQAMLAGDATAAVNLAKIYYKIDNNSPRAASCLVIAEASNDDSVKDDVVMLRGYLGEDYLKGVASNVVQLISKTAEAGRERASLMKQIAVSMEEAKKKDEKFEHERDDFDKKLAAASREESRKKDEEFARERDDFDKKLAAAEKRIKELEEELDNRSCGSGVGVAQPCEDSSADNGYSTGFGVGNPYVYDGAFVAAGSAKPRKGQLDCSEEGGFDRGWNTFWCAPCNFVRVGAATKYVYDAASQSSNKVCGFFASAISAPVILCCEVVPTVCDLGNGFLDMLTFGAYGNWLYSDGLTHTWWNRDDTHFFPWIDRDN